MKSSPAKVKHTLELCLTLCRSTKKTDILAFSPAQSHANTQSKASWRQVCWLQLWLLSSVDFNGVGFPQGPWPGVCGSRSGTALGFPKIRHWDSASSVFVRSLAGAHAGWRQIQEPEHSDARSHLATKIQDQFQLRYSKKHWKQKLLGQDEVKQKQQLKTPRHHAVAELRDDSCPGRLETPSPTRAWS